MSPQVTAAIIAASVGVLTVIATVVTQSLGRRATSRDTQKALEAQRVQLDTTLEAQHAQLDTTLEAQHAQLDRTLEAQHAQLDRTLTEQRSRTLNERFATAAAQMGSDKPAAVRLAGIYAMAGLADDWEENRQVCVDVLCAFLRMPYEPDPGDKAPDSERLAFRANREVRHTVIRVITAHLIDEAGKSWQGLNFDFTDAVFDGGDFRNARFSGSRVSFDGASFPGGKVDFGRAQFSGGRVSFDGAKFSGGTVDFTVVEFSGGWVDFGGAEFSGGRVTFGSAKFSGGTVDFAGSLSGSTVFSGSRVDFGYAEFSSGEVRFGSHFSVVQFSGGEVSFDAAEFSGGTVSFARAKFSGGTVSFRSARFSGSMVDFSDARFSGSTVEFRAFEFPVYFTRGGAEGFFGGTVDFSSAEDWSVPPTFSWTGVPPVVVKLPRKVDESPL